MKFTPGFSMKDEVHFWTNIVYDSLTSTYFLSTYTEGLYQVQLKKIQVINLKDKLVNESGNTINYALLKTSDSSVLTATGFEFTDRGNYNISVKKKGNISGNGKTIARLGDTAILCVQNNRLFFYSQSDGFQHSRIFNQSFNNEYRSFVTLLQPEGDSVWVGSDLGIFSLRQNNTRVLYYRKPDGQSLYFGPHLFYRLSEDELFFSNNFGLFKIRTSSPYTIDTFPEMKDKQVNCIVKYKDVFLLSVYKYGLFVLDGNAFHKVPVSEDQPELSFCHSVYIDRSENVWVTTDKGLYRSSVTGILESVSKSGNRPFFLSYGEREGLINTEFNSSGTPVYAVLANEQLFYPSPGGVITFNPSTLNSEFIKGPIHIDRIQVDDTITDVLIADSIYLKPDFKLLGIDLSIPHFSEPKNLLIEYNFDNEGWKKIETLPSQRIMLYNIPPDYHQLIIRKRVGFGSADYVYKKFVIYRRKHIYQQPWLYPVLTLAFILFVLLIIKLRRENIDRHRRQLQIRVDEQTSELSEAVKAKELLIDIISDDMITPLRHVGLIAGMLRKDIEKGSRKLNDALSDIKATSGKILTDSLGIINYMKYNSSRVIINRQEVNLYDTINEVGETVLAAVRSKDISLINNVNKYLFIEIDDNIFRIILNNIISNAIRYSGDDTVQIFLEPGSEIKAEIILKIRDNGTGISNEMLDKIRELVKGNLQVIKTINNPSIGLSYVLISELTRIHGLSISVDSELDKGTTVSIGIPNNLSEPESITF